MTGLKAIREIIWITIKDVGLECPQQGDYEEGDSLD